MTHAITVIVNGVVHAAEVEPRLLLVHYLRDSLALTGTHIGCDTSQCGACTALLGREPTPGAIAAAAANVAEAIEHPLSDRYASGDYRIHLATVLAKRALTDAVGRAR